MTGEILPESPDAEDSADRNFINALSRGLAIIRAFANQRDQLTLSEISRLVDLPRATARRVLITLTKLGYVDSNGKYFKLTPKVLTLAQAYFSSAPLPHIARPYLEHVSSTLGESCSLSVLSGEEVIYIARSSLKRSASVEREVGVNLPAYCTSMGRVLLASLSQEDLDAYFNRAVIRKFNEKTVTDPQQLRHIIDHVRQQGFCIIDGELEPTLRAVAVPVRNAAGLVVAAAHISTDPNRVSVERLTNEFLPILQESVRQIRRALVG